MTFNLFIFFCHCRWRLWQLWSIWRINIWISWQFSSYLLHLTWVQQVRSICCLVKSIIFSLIKSRGSSIFSFGQPWDVLVSHLRTHKLSVYYDDAVYYRGQHLTYSLLFHIYILALQTRRIQHRLED